MKVVLGVDKFIDVAKKWCGTKGIAVLTNASGVDSQLRKNIDVFMQKGIKVEKIFVPEHGLESSLPDGAPVPDHRYRGIPVFSLFGKRAGPTEEMLADVDLFVYDIQDVGLRFYTYIYALAGSIKQCGKQGIKAVILDRPNPLSWQVSGPVIKKECESLVGGYGLALRYGLTPGELARYFTGMYRWDVDLEVFTMEGYDPRAYYDETGLLWNTPSPNLPSLEHTILYSGLCLLEGVNVSVGRGTVHPFKYIGAPWIDAKLFYRELKRIDLPGLAFRERAFIPLTSKFQNQVCRGLEFFVLDRRALDPLRLALHVIRILKRIHPDHFRWDSAMDGKPYFDLLIGDSYYREAIERGVSPEELILRWKSEEREFAQIVEPFRLYWPRGSGRGRRR